MYKLRYTYNDGQKMIIPLITETLNPLAEAQNAIEDEVQELTTNQLGRHGVVKLEVIGDAWNKKNRVFELRTFDAEGRLR